MIRNHDMEDFICAMLSSGFVPASVVIEEVKSPAPQNAPKRKAAARPAGEKEEVSVPKSLVVERILRYGPVSEIHWADGTKTRVKRMSGEKEDPHTAFCAALAKKIYGSNRNVIEMIEAKTKIVVPPDVRKRRKKAKAEAKK